MDRSFSSPLNLGSKCSLDTHGRKTPNLSPRESGETFHRVHIRYLVEREILA